MVQTRQTASNRLRVLMSEEPGGWHETVRGLLEPQGVETVFARSGRDALRVLESSPIHVAVLDQDMPQLGGLQVVRLVLDRARASSGASGTALAPRTILVASQLTNHLLAEALAADVFTVLKHPVDLNLLLDALARILRRYHGSRWPGEG